jgi:hypothetical protein
VADRRRDRRVAGGPGHEGRRLRPARRHIVVAIVGALVGGFLLGALGIGGSAGLLGSIVAAAALPRRLSNDLHGAHAEAEQSFLRVSEFSAS